MRSGPSDSNMNSMFKILIRSLKWNQMFYLNQHLNKSAWIFLLAYLKYFFPQSKYKEGGRKSLSQSFYSQLPETAETQFAKSVSDLQSQVRRRWSEKPCSCSGTCEHSNRLISDQIQGVREERRELQSVLSAAGDDRNGSGQRGFWALQRGKTWPTFPLKPVEPVKPEGSPTNMRLETSFRIKCVTVSLSLLFDVLLSGFDLQLKYKEDGRKEASLSLYAVLPVTMETQRAKEASSLQSQVRRRAPAWFWNTRMSLYMNL